MSDDISTLATDYYDFRHRASPTSAHLDGDYRFAGIFEDPGRAAEDGQISENRRFVERARAIPEAGLGVQDRISREMVAWDANARADVLEARMAEYTVNPISGLQAMLPVYLPKLGFPTVEVAEELTGKLRGIGEAFRAMADRLRAGATDGRTPAAFAVEATIPQLDAWLALPIEADPLLNAHPTAHLADRSAWQSRLEAVIESEVRPALVVYRNVLKDEILPHARPDARVGLKWLAGGEAAYASAIRFYTTVDKSARRSTRSASGRSSSSPASIASSGRRSPARTTSTRSSPPFGPIPPSTTSRPTMSSPMPRPPWPRRRRRWAAGSASCPGPIATSKP